VLARSTRMLLSRVTQSMFELPSISHDAMPSGGSPRSSFHVGKPGRR
jgi:hypothetical protein